MAGWDSELLVTLRQDGVLLLGPMCTHLLTCGHHFAFDATYGTYVPTGEESIGRTYTTLPARSVETCCVRRSGTPLRAY